MSIGLNATFSAGKAFLRAGLDLPRYLPLILAAKKANTEFARRNENTAISDQGEQVANYDRVMTSKLAVFYALGLQTLHRLGDFTGKSALDLAPGPGHFSLCLQHYLKLKTVAGLDLSQPMIDIACRNAELRGVSDAVKFGFGNATNLPTDLYDAFDLVTMTFAAHHLRCHADLTLAIAEMERAVKPPGTIVILDLARLPSAELTEKFVRLAGRDYLRQGLPYFYQDFYESMFAAWSFEETAQAIRNGSGRTWIQWGMSGLPTLQILIGLPSHISPDHAFARKGTPWRQGDHLLIPRLRPEYGLARTLLALGKKRVIHGQAQNHVSIAG